MRTPEGIRPIVTVTGSHQRTCVFGTITIDGKQLFRQYDVQPVCIYKVFEIEEEV